MYEVVHWRNVNATPSHVRDLSTGRFQCPCGSWSSRIYVGGNGSLPWDGVLPPAGRPGLWSWRRMDERVEKAAEGSAAVSPHCTEDRHGQKRLGTVSGTHFDKRGQPPKAWIVRKGSEMPEGQSLDVTVLVTHVLVTVAWSPPEGMSTSRVAI